MVSVANLSDWLLILVIIMSLRVESNYMTRSSIVANTVSIFTATAHHWNAIPWPLQAYAVLGLFFCAFAFLSYMFGSSLDYRFYDSAWWLFNTVVATVYVVVAGFLS